MKGTDNPNKIIWDQLKVTDPKFTKKINKVWRYYFDRSYVADR